MTLVLALFAGASLGLAICVALLISELKFEREWRQEEEAQHEKWFRIAVGNDE